MQNFQIKAAILGTLLISYSFFGQVGINTATPQSTLDVNGDIAMRNALNLEVTNVANGNEGVANQLLVSQGVGNTALWKTAKVSFLENEQYKLINTYLQRDDVGIQNPAVSTPNVSVIGEAFDSRWLKIDNLTTEIEIKAAQNKVTYHLQSGVELVNKSVGAGSSVNYICGIFKAAQLATPPQPVPVLVALRPDVITTVDTNPVQGMFTLNYTEVNAAVGTYVYSVACRKTGSTDNTNNYFRVGINNASYGPNPVTINTFSTPFALRSLFKIDVAELVTYTN